MDKKTAPQLKVDLEALDLTKASYTLAELAKMLGIPASNAYAAFAKYGTKTYQNKIVLSRHVARLAIQTWVRKAKLKGISELSR